MVGVLSDIAHATRSTFKAEGESIILFGRFTNELGASEYLARIHGVVAGAPPTCDLAAERAAIDALVECIEGALVSSAHDCSDGGFAVALAECCIANREQLHGADVRLTSDAATSNRAALFGEAQGRFIVSSANPASVLSVAQAHGVPAANIGTVTNESAGLRIATGTTTLVANVRDLADEYHNTIPSIMARTALASDAEPEPVLASV
jgi:phosphoribosylformylglycinamidine synthase